MITLSPNYAVLAKGGPAVIPLSGPITTLHDGECFVFGSNASGGRVKGLPADDAERRCVWAADHAPAGTPDQPR